MEDGSSIGVGLTVMALIRAIESYRHERDRLFEDRFSRRLLLGLWKILLLPGFRHAIVALGELRGPGALGNLYCRTRYIDDSLRKALQKNVEQVVILGAGFDTRSYRTPDIERVRVFELDLPEVMKLKQARLKKTLGTLPSHVTFVSIDFDRQDLEGKIAAAGFRSGVKTFYIWEGVTQYITGEAVDGMFRYIARAATQGSEAVFAYIDQGIINGSDRSLADEKLVAAARRGGMPWIFGIEPGKLGEYLSERGFELVEEVWNPYYQEHYLKPSGRRMSVFEGERVVLAEVMGGKSL